jgi:hypothetical protein
MKLNVGAIDRTLQGSIGLLFVSSALIGAIGIWGYLCVRRSKRADRPGARSHGGALGESVCSRLRDLWLPECRAHSASRICGQQ